MPNDKGVKKATCVKKDLPGLTEMQAWKVVDALKPSQRALNPWDMFRMASAATGCPHTQAMTVLCAISSTFLTELDTKGMFFLPGFGTFHKQVQGWS